MMNEFVTSEGYSVLVNRYGGNLWQKGGGESVSLSVLQVQALREFFMVERDEELGRWRDPEDPSMVCYPTTVNNYVQVIDEVTGNCQGWARADAQLSSASLMFGGRTAKRYFGVHPDQGWKPWHDAKSGEVWELEHRGEVHAYMVAKDGSFEGAYYVIRDTVDEVVSGRLIWSPDNSADLI